MSYVGITCYGQMYWGVGIDDDIIRSSISALVVAVNQVPSIKSSVEIQDKRLMEMKNYIQTNYQTVTLEDMAKQFHLSEPYISKYIKEKSGQTFVELVQGVRMKKARTL